MSKKKEAVGGFIFGTLFSIFTFLFICLVSDAAMATIDDQATQFEELDRELSLKIRKPSGPPACGACYNCGEEVFSGLRWCDEDCRDDWEARERK